MSKGMSRSDTRNADLLNRMQNHVFEQLGYLELGKALRVPLVNIHTVEMVRIKVPGGFVYDEVTIHHTLTDTDLLCSVPVMKAHILAHEYQESFWIGLAFDGSTLGQSRERGATRCLTSSILRFAVPSSL